MEMQIEGRGGGHLSNESSLNIENFLFGPIKRILPGRGYAVVAFAQNVSLRNGNFK